MEQKMYSVSIGENCNIFVIAFSKEHAIVEVVNSHIENNIIDYPTDYSVNDVKELSPKEMKKIIIDYNYVTEKLEKVDLYTLYKRLIKLGIKEGELDFYGVVSDDFVIYD